ncbi:hypothetical protein C8Q77DRAFT_465703 [Trametes polyzona]|nr:hypothetical protein C8Q77DRAFT_465703 [Trametes polyzona]
MNEGRHPERLYGLTIYQTYQYFRMYPNDHILAKAFVAILWVLEAFHIVIWMIVGYHYLIYQPITCGGEAQGYWSPRLSVITTLCTISVTQCFYASRIYLFDPRLKRLVISAMVSMVTSLGFAVAAAVQAFRRTPSIHDFQYISWLVSVAFGLSAITDVVLAGTLVFALQRSRTGSKRGDSMLDTLIVYTMNTGVLTSLCSTLSFVFALILPGNLIYAGISIVGTKLYANSALAILNSRRAINNRFHDDLSLAHVSHTMEFGALTPRGPIVWNASHRSIRPSERASAWSGTSSSMAFATASQGSEGTWAEGENPACGGMGSREMGSEM